MLPNASRMSAIRPFSIRAAPAKQTLAIAWARRAPTLR
jgi:hypothetical protein